ncbi:hypothetical protein TG4357_01816 [Thalassovita gelatinovora]|uniref:DUF4139 domain-containing protein n=1 Tax=Thalassovita gelatinovora TaxID=53501 RepID=A0A0P1FAZ7_THAGE|nr:DUF4139 domain-containing protein [Thalassovita gelatinovora]QIZ80733.1 mucoidy inhibitor MuiA family protein [Thalassovita gelatinovora]CUH65353.1 hypothetical protein TG4357_01816 [Thalassovita gelatinovora]SEQ89819.1 conserved hypothetical protein [Thalassovita gelatinovora]
MRPLVAVLCFLPSLGLADVIRVDSRIVDVTVYPQGAKITRVADFSMPEGDHTLRVLDLPHTAMLDMVRAKVEGARMGSVSLRDSFVPPRGDSDSAAIKAARAEVERREEALRSRQDDAAGLRLAREAAETRIGFLRQLGEGKALEGAAPDTLRDVARMVGEETLAARRAVIAAEAEARGIDRDIAELKQDLEQALQALQAVQTGGGPTNLVEVSVSAGAAQTGKLVLSYYSAEASWEAVNDAYLTLGDTPGVDLQRGAMVWQQTGENWDDVALTLSTSAPSGRFQPGEVTPWLRRIGEPYRAAAKMAADSLAGAPMVEPMVMMEEARAVSLHGLIYNYGYPKPVTVASDADGVRIALGDVHFDAAIRAVAAPQWDETAYLVAEFVNGSGELLLPTGVTQLYLEGEFVGATATDKIAAGAEATLPFGAIEGVRVNRVVTRNEGDAGILSQSNEETETVRIAVENLTGRGWPMRIVDRVPYSEQEDLTITWQARPTPSEKDVDGKTGVLAWEFDIAPGDSRRIELSHKMQWPKDMLLR